MSDGPAPSGAGVGGRCPTFLEATTVWDILAGTEGAPPATDSNTTPLVA